MADNQGSSGNSGNNAGMFAIAIVLLLAVLVGGYLFEQSNNSTFAKNDAVAGAANAVGKTADKVGNAADKASSN